MARCFMVHARSPRATVGWIEGDGIRFHCALGRGGRRASKREGDGATPIGVWPVRAIHYRADRLRRPFTHVPVRPIRPDDGWCDAAADRNYNRRVRYPYSASAEEMWRADPLYDLVVELGYNDRPRRRGFGSAIFMHVARPGYLPTAGCIALERAHLLRLVALLRPCSVIRVRG